MKFRKIPIENSNRRSCLLPPVFENELSDVVVMNIEVVESFFWFWSQNQANSVVKNKPEVSGMSHLMLE